MSADGSFFVDTNVLLYSGDPADAVKQRAAHQWLSALWEQGAGRLSWQVLHEFYVNVVSSSSTKTWFPALPPKRGFQLFHQCPSEIAGSELKGSRYRGGVHALEAGRHGWDWYGAHGIRQVRPTCLTGTV
jgi:hypothetical protein